MNKKSIVALLLCICMIGTFTNVNVSAKTKTEKEGKEVGADDNFFSKDFKEFFENSFGFIGKTTKKVVEASAKTDVPVYTVTDEEYEILCRIVEAETDGTLEQKQNVCSCVMSRVESKEFPNTIKGVVFQKTQFTPIIDGRYYSVTVSDRTKEAVNNILQDGIKFTDVNGNVDTKVRYLFFCAYGTEKRSNFFAGMDKKETAMLDGTHRYYKG